MLTPAQWKLTLYPGGTFDPLFTFYTDTARTQPLDLTGYSAQLSIGDGALVFSSAGGGLVLGGIAGTVQVVGPPSQTQKLSVQGEPLDWFLQWTDPSGNVNFPIAGELQVSEP